MLFICAFVMVTSGMVNVPVSGGTALHSDGIINDAIANKILILILFFPISILRLIMTSYELHPGNFNAGRHRPSGYP